MSIFHLLSFYPSSPALLIRSPLSGAACGLGNTAASRHPPAPGKSVLALVQNS